MRPTASAAVADVPTALRRAAVRATYAPSLHNTQPWRLHLRAGRLDIYADRTRQLSVLDPTGRQLLLSCGCAVLNARVALAADGLDVDVRRRPDPLDPELLASLVPVPRPGNRELAALDAVLEARQTNRRPFVDDAVPPDVLAALQDAARQEGAELVPVQGPDQLDAVAALREHAEEVAALNPAYRAEWRAWTSGDDPDHSDAASPGAQPFLVLLSTSGDAPNDWLRAGEALERVLLLVTQLGFAASPVSHLTEVPSSRAGLRQRLGMSGYPHLLLRIGRAPAGAPSRRRRLVDLLVVDEVLTTEADPE